MNCRLILFSLPQILLLDLLTCSAAPAKVVACQRPAIDNPNSHFKLQVDDTAIDCVGTVMQVGYAHFSFSGRVRLELTASEPIERFDLSPHRLGIGAVIRGTTRLSDYPRGPGGLAHCVRWRAWLSKTKSRESMPVLTFPKSGFSRYVNRT